MTAATVTSKGRITVPAEVRQALQVKEGDRVEFVEVAPGRYELLAAAHSITQFKRTFGNRFAKPVSIEEMNRVIAQRGASAR